MISDNIGSQAYIDSVTFSGNMKIYVKIKYAGFDVKMWPQFDL